MIHTVVVWQCILVLVKLVPSYSQAFLRATHFTHGCVAHGGRHSSPSHQSESKRVQYIKVIIFSVFASLVLCLRPPTDLPKPPSNLTLLKHLQSAQLSWTQVVP